MRKPLLAAAFLAVSGQVFAPSARAEEISAFDQAYSTRSRSSKVAAGGLTLLASGLTGFGAALADENVADKAQRLRNERQRIARILATRLPQHRVHISKELELELLKDKPFGTLTKQDKARMQSLRGEIEAYPGRGVVAQERAWALRDTEDLETGRSFLQNDKRAVRTAKFLRFGAALATLGLVAEGSYEILHALWEKDPGYSPAVNLSRTESKQTTAPVAPRTGPAADTSFSAE